MASRPKADIRQVRRDLRKAYRDFRQADRDTQLRLAVERYEETLALAVSLAGRLECGWYPAPKKRKKTGPTTFSDKDLVDIVDGYKEKHGRKMTDAAAIRAAFDHVYRSLGLATHRWRRQERTLRNRLSKARKLVTN